MINNSGYSLAKQKKKIYEDNIDKMIKEYVDNPIVSLTSLCEKYGVRYDKARISFRIAGYNPMRGNRMYRSRDFTNKLYDITKVV